MTDPRAPLHLAAFDHRESFVSMIRPIAPESIGADQRVALKLMIWRGIARRLDASAQAGVLVDPDAASVVDAANAGRAVTALALERSGQRWLEPDRELAALAALLGRHRPTYGKVLMRWHPHDDAEHRAAQVRQLGELFSMTRDAGVSTLLELLIPAAGSDAALSDAEPDVYRSEVLPIRLADSVRQLADAGIVPDLWKIDGLDRHGSSVVVGQAVAETSGDRAGIVVLGAGRELDQLAAWFRATSGVPGFCGFAIGRSIWWGALRRHLQGELDADATEAAIGDEFAAVVATYEGAIGPVTPT